MKTSNYVGVIWAWSWSPVAVSTPHVPRVPSRVLTATLRCVTLRCIIWKCHVKMAGMICRVGFPLTFSNVYFPASCATQHNRGMQKENLLECCGGVGTWMIILHRKQISQVCSIHNINILSTASIEVHRVEGSKNLWFSKGYIFHPFQALYCRAWCAYSKKVSYVGVGPSKVGQKRPKLLLASAS